MAIRQRVEPARELTMQRVFRHTVVAADPRPFRKASGTCRWVHSSVVRAADCRSAGPWFKSRCALMFHFTTVTCSQRQSWKRASASFAAKGRTELPRTLSSKSQTTQRQGALTFLHILRRLSLLTLAEDRGSPGCL